MTKQEILKALIDGANRADETGRTRAANTLTRVAREVKAMGEEEFADDGSVATHPGSGSSFGFSLPDHHDQGGDEELGGYQHAEAIPQEEIARVTRDVEGGVYDTLANDGLRYGGRRIGQEAAALFERSLRSLQSSGYHVPPDLWESASSLAWELAPKVERLRRDIWAQHGPQEDMESVLRHIDPRGYEEQFTGIAHAAARFVSQAFRDEVAGG